jgi:hypothetical protein
VNLAASLKPPLSEFDLLGALTSHYSSDIQKCIISANLKSTQEVLTFLGKLQTLEGGEFVNKGQEENQKGHSRKNNQETDNRNENRAGYRQNVRQRRYSKQYNNNNRQTYLTH